MHINKLFKTIYVDECAFTYFANICKTGISKLLSYYYRKEPS